ncbi:MAG: response regulator [Desulfobacterales bacterium]|nr:response regulator [Desulfobacterales bacterium]
MHWIPKHVLVVDDEASILKLLSNVLHRRGIKVDTAESGRDGLTMIKDKSYDLVITDLKMPGFTGRDFLTEIRRIKGAALPVIGMSGTPWMLENTEFDAVLVKPFSQAALFDTFDTIGAAILG